MIISAIELVGWMPFAKKLRLELPAGPIAIVGTHSGDPRRSNRAGKSSLLEAITWCLYGKHRKRTDDAVINKECDACEVALEFDVDVDYFYVTRSKKRGSPTRLEVRFENTESVGEAAQLAIEQMLGLSATDYQQTNCFRQGEVDSLIARPASERLAVVSEWLDQKKWLHAKKLQGAKVARVAEELAGKRGELNGVRAQVLVPALYNALGDEAKRVQLRKEQLTVEIQSLTNQVRLASEVELQQRRAHERNALRVAVLELRPELAKKPAALAALADAEESERLANLEVQRASAEWTGMQQIRGEGFDGTCPLTCSQCPVADSVEAAVKQNTERLHQLQDVFFKSGENRTAAINARATAQEVVRHFEIVTARYNNMVERGRELAKQVTSEPLPNIDIQAVELELAKLRESERTAISRLAEIRTMRATTERAGLQQKELVNAIESLEEAAQASSLALKAIASVPAKIASEQLGELEQEANVLLSGSGVSIRFGWQRELAEKSALCNDCGFTYGSQRLDECPTCKAPRGKKLANELEILCDDGSGLEEDVRFNSGGTRALVGAALRLAASGMLRRLRSSPTAWAVVDEPFGSLDAENRESLARAFAGMLGSVGLEQALVVSHDPLLLAALPYRITIDKDGTASTARLE